MATLGVQLDAKPDGVLPTTTQQFRADYRACYVGCLKGVSKSVQVLLHGIEAAMVLTLIILK